MKYFFEQNMIAVEICLSTPQTKFKETASRIKKKHTG